MKQEAGPALVFTGHEGGLIPWTLLGFVLLSAFLHLFGFYVFQTVYPPAGHVAPPPPQVSLLTPGTPEADALLRWVDAADPALIAQPRRAPIPGLQELPYVPSYATVRARPVLVGPKQQPIPFPAGVSGLELVKLALPRPPRPEARPEKPPTTLTFSGDLRGERPGATVATLHAAQPGNLRPARFLLGVSDRGEVRFVFLQESSGDKQLDADAGRALAQAQLAHLPAPLTWGFATFSWGAEAYAPPAPAQ